MVYDPNDIHRITEGSTPYVIREIKKYARDPLPVFYRYVVLDCVTDPHVIDETKLSYWHDILQVSNWKYASILPRNTIIAQRILNNQIRFSQPIFLFPFFPSHISFPCKPGEMVWAMFEDPSAKVKEIGYWFCKITEPHFVDDVNHTHHARQLDSSFVSFTKDKYELQENPVYDLTNGVAVKDSDGSRRVRENTEIIEGSESVFEEKLRFSDASKMTQYEAVPRFRKRPGDVVLEGSNNSLIVLGTDRTGPAVNYDPLNPNEKSYGIINKIDLQSNDLSGSAGSIDMVVGRGTTERTGGKVANTVSVTNDHDVIKQELGKSKKELSQDEGDPDFVNDRSRVLISQRTNPDTNFGIDGYNSVNFGINDSPEGDAAIVIKSDKVRIIARSDISFIVTDFDPVPPLGDKQGYKSDNTDTGRFASITIKQDGNIVFTPSLKGYIKLGGDDASKAILCTERPASAVDGVVTAMPIASTGGGFVGTNGGTVVDKEAVAFQRSPDLGTFSTKVLVV